MNRRSGPPGRRDGRRWPPTIGARLAVPTLNGKTDGENDLAANTRDRTRHEGEHDDSHEGDRRSGLSLRCTGCRFLIVVSSVAQARSLGWVNINTENGSGLCRACRANMEG